MFEQIKLEWPNLTPVKTAEQAIQTFKLGNTQL